MNDEMSPAPQPAAPMQPVSMHEKHGHSHGSLHLIVGLLGVLLVLETIVLGYVVTQYVVDEEVETVTEDDEMVVEKESVPPFIYAKDNKELYIVDRETGEENLIYASTSAAAQVGVFAVPQVGYDGRIYISRFCSDCDSPTMKVQEVNLLLPEQAPVPLDKWTLPRGSAEVSPDEVQVAMARYANEETGHAGDVVVLNLLTGQEEVIGQLASDEYFSRYFGENVFARAGDFNLSWVDRSCFDVYIYQDDPADPSSGTKSFKEIRNYCTSD